MKADVRRALTVHLLDTELSEYSSVNPDFLRKRAALRLRTLRTFFCCRSFSVVFFTPSEKEESHSPSRLDLKDERVWLHSASYGPRSFVLDRVNAGADSVGRILALAREEAGEIFFWLDCDDSLTLNLMRTWAAVFSPLNSGLLPIFFTAFTRSGSSSLPRLDVGVNFYQSAWFVHLLRDFFPSNIVRFSTRGHHEFIFLAPYLKSKSAIISKARKLSDVMEKHSCEPLLYTHQSTLWFPVVPPFFRMPARELALESWMPKVAANGP